MDELTASTAKLIDGIAPAMKALADKFGTTAEHLYTVLCKQSVIDGIGNFIICGIIFIFAIALVWGIKYFIKKLSDKDCSSSKFEGYMIGLIVCGMILICAIGIMGNNAIAGMKHCINPEYYAVKDVLSNIK